VDNWFLAFLQDFHPQPHPKGYLSSRLSQVYKTPIPYPDFHSDNLHALIGEVIMYCCLLAIDLAKELILLPSLMAKEQEVNKLNKAIPVAFVGH
jgi:hypothetical protein